MQAMPTSLAFSRRARRAPRVGSRVKRKAILGIVLVIGTLLMLVAPASSNVIPGDPRVGSRAVTKQWCFVGTVTFAIFGNGVYVVVGTAVADPNSSPNKGTATLEFTVPDVVPGKYLMIGSGTGCDGKPFQVGVDFTIRERAGGPNYPPVGCQARLEDIDRDNRPEVLLRKSNYEVQVYRETAGSVWVYSGKFLTSDCDTSNPLDFATSAIGIAQPAMNDLEFNGRRYRLVDACPPLPAPAK